MNRLKLIEQLDAQFPNVFRVLLLVSKSPRKTARPYQQLARRSVVMMRFLARERVTSDVIQQSLAHAHSGNAKRSQVQVARSEEHTSELQSRLDLLCRLLPDK